MVCVLVLWWWVSELLEVTKTALRRRVTAFSARQARSPTAFLCSDMVKTPEFAAMSAAATNESPASFPWDPVSPAHRPAPGPPSTSKSTRSSMSPRAPRTGAHISASSFAEPRALTSDEWVEPRSPREQDLQVRLLRTQKELHRARSELARRTEAHAERQKKDSTGKAEEGKPDWTLALRYRLTAELRAEMNRLETGWAADRL